VGGDLVSRSAALPSPAGAGTTVAGVPIPEDTVVRQYLRHLNAGQWSELASLFHPEGVAWLDEATPFVGSSEIQRMYADTISARFRTYLADPVYLLCSDRVGLVYEVVDVTTLDGRAEQHHRVEVFEFRDGKIASVRAFRQGSL
jgi:ketosteroid isomerase-like protein